ncbi:permase [Shewanella mangrovi]|uniref:Permase n=1 Tax=Shewanella mangrovi TaxID=1515746 RepID=A0A094JGX5_9GAMM|nr:AI-2E family transporter [Shewanella mangrovi]KFZ38457.1 permase [Shewanella mangrovi]
MFEYIRRWYQARFSDPQALTLMFILVLLGVVILYAGNLLMPLLLALVLAYLLEWPVAKMAKIGINRTMAASLVLLVFVTVMLLITFGVIPSVWRQATAFLGELPKMIDRGVVMLQHLANEYPQFVSSDQIDTMLAEVKKLMDSEHVLNIIKQLLGYSASLLVLMVYAILVPLLVFFFLKDKDELISGSRRFLPRDRELVKKVWLEMDQQIFNYIRGKIIELVIVGIASYIFFALMGLNYAVLLGVSVGVSVLIPYVGATLVTLPIAAVAFFQWGASAEFGYLMIGYGIIQALDGNLLVPLLFSDAVDLHPVFIIAAVLIFGGLWGVWGVFFAIPLASLVKAVVNVWPNEYQHHQALSKNE